MSRLLFISFILLVYFTSCSQVQSESQWRGPDRKGIFHEEGLLRSWPDEGPQMLWSYESLGAGHSSPGIGNGAIYINGMPDTLGILYCFDMNGNLKWKKSYGEEWHSNYVGARSTPLVIDDLVYLESGMGVVLCFDANSGEIKWSVDLLKRFDGKNIRWGMSESLLIYDNKLICTPGGEQNNVVALDRLTGETIWTSPGFGEPSAYCSPVLIRHNQAKLIVTMTATSVIGLDAETGEMYWREEQRQGNLIHANTPVYEDGVVYCSSSSSKVNGGLLALQLSEDGTSVTKLWRNEQFKNLMGGIIVTDTHVYGSKYRSQEWYAIDRETGEANLLTDNFQHGVILFADGLFYCYNEKGEVALVEMTPDRFSVISQFDVPLGDEQHWAHPVIHDKRMYIRHGNALMVYDLGAI